VGGIRKPLGKREVTYLWKLTGRQRVSPLKVKGNRVTVFAEILGNHPLTEKKAQREWKKEMSVTATD